METGQNARSSRPRHGFISVRANNVDTARVYIDGRDVGYSPVTFHRLRAGKHRIRIVEEKGGEKGRVSTTEVTVTAKHTRKSPFKLVIPL